MQMLTPNNFKGALDIVRTGLPYYSIIIHACKHFINSLRIKLCHLLSQITTVFSNVLFHLWDSYCTKAYTCLSLR